MTEQTKREFFLLVVEKETTRCWSWIGDHDADKRPIFRGEKAYRLMYELRNGDIPAGFHVHHKCENSACVNPRHLVALSPEDHRAVHATKDEAIKELIYRGEWAKIQAARAEAARLERERLERERVEREERLERQRIERERVAKEQEEARQRRIAEIERWRREYPWLVRWERCKVLSRGLLIVLISGLIGTALTYSLWAHHDLDGVLIIGLFTVLFLAAGVRECFTSACADDVLARAYEQYSARFPSPSGAGLQRPGEKFLKKPKNALKDVFVTICWASLFIAPATLFVLVSSFESKPAASHYRAESTPAGMPRLPSNFAVSSTPELTLKTPRAPTPDSSSPFITPFGQATVTPTPGPTAMQNRSSATWPDGKMLGHPEHFVRSYVVNVSPNDTLKLRSGPGTKFKPVADLPANAANISAYDQDQVWDGDTWWCPVEWNGLRGYISRDYLPK